MTLIQVSPSDNAYVYSLNPTSNFGSSTLLFTGTGSQLSYKFRTLFKFDLSDLIPPGNTVTSASLELFVYKKDKPDSLLSPQNVTVSTNSSNFSQNTVTWNNAPATSVTPYHVNVTDADVNKYISIDITNVVIGWINTPSLNYGITLKGMENVIDSVTIANSVNITNSVISYFPTNRPVQTQKPFLKIEYTENSTLLPDHAYIFNTGTQTIGVESDVPFNLNGSLSGITHSVNSTNINIRNSGLYSVLFSVTGISPNQFALFKNNNLVSDTIYGIGPGPLGPYTNNTGIAVISADAGDTLTLRNHTSPTPISLANTAGGTATNVSASILIIRIGENNLVNPALNAVNTALDTTQMRTAITNPNLGLDLTAFNGLIPENQDIVLQGMINDRPVSGYPTVQSVQEALNYEISKIVNSNYIYVKSNSVGGDGSLANPFSSIQDGINAVNAGGVVNILNGTYQVSTTINANKTGITLLGTNHPVIMLQADTIPLLVLNPNITVDGLTMTSATPYQKEFIQVGGNNVTLRNNTIYGPPQASPMSSWVVNRAVVSQNNVTGISLQNNTFYSLRTGMYINPNTTGTINNNVVYNTKGGFLVDRAFTTFTGNSWGTPDNEYDIVLLVGTTTGYPYNNLPALSAANSNANISDQR